MNPQIAKELESTNMHRASIDSNFDRILSAKAFHFGAESGITAEFIVRQGGV